MCTAFIIPKINIFRKIHMNQLNKTGEYGLYTCMEEALLVYSDILACANIMFLKLGGKYS